MFKIGDIVICNHVGVYRITNSNNPCVVTMSQDYNKIFNLQIGSNNLIVAPLIFDKKSQYEVDTRYFRKIQTTDSKYNLHKGDQVVLRDVCEKVLDVPKNSVGEIVSFINEKDIRERFGEIMVSFPALEKHEIIRKNYIKNLTTL